MAPSGPRHSVSVAAAIIDDLQRVLVVRRRDNGKWEPPGGVLEQDEGIHAGLIREVKEETGLLIEPLDLSGVYKNMTQTIVALVFRCRVTEGAMRPTPEAAELCWMDAEAIQKRLDAAYSCRLLDALGTGPPAVRAHDGVNLIDEEQTQAF